MVKPLAIIIKGNPKYINDPKISAMAIAFYLEIKRLLVAKGFRVTFNSGTAYTTPKLTAKVWIAHSRGIDRLQYAPASVQTIALRTRDRGSDGYKTKDEPAHDPLHYQLSAEDRIAIDNLKP